MKIEFIVGLLLLTTVFICGTLLLLKRMEIAHAERIERENIKSAERNKREQIRMDSAANNWANLYEEEKHRRLETETKMLVLRKKLEVANSVIEKFGALSSNIAKES